MPKAVLVKGKLQSSVVGPLYHVKHTVDMENGMCVGIGTRSTTQGYNNDANGHIHAVATAQTVADLESGKLVFALLGASEIMYAQGVYITNDSTVIDNDRLDNFYLAAGVAGRAYGLSVGDVFTVADTLIDGITVVGEYVVPQVNSLKWKATANGQITGVLPDTNPYTANPRLLLKVEKKHPTLGVGREGLGVAQPSTELRVVRVQ